MKARFAAMMGDVLMCEGAAGLLYSEGVLVRSGLTGSLQGFVAGREAGSVHSTEVKRPVLFAPLGN